mmetsp:Transcript_27694/g.42622  ORF Transcript_27694/g.42622 Transcript_27694/m.42622 type:complete len:207 (-) Transcript_27694:171-791(-)
MQHHKFPNPWKAHNGLVQTGMMCSKDTFDRIPFRCMFATSKNEFLLLVHPLTKKNPKWNSSQHWYSRRRVWMFASKQQRPNFPCLFCFLRFPSKHVHKPWQYCKHLLHRQGRPLVQESQSHHLQPTYPHSLHYGATNLHLHIFERVRQPHRRSHRCRAAFARFVRVPLEHVQSMLHSLRCVCTLNPVQPILCNLQNSTQLALEPNC